MSELSKKGPPPYLEWPDPTAEEILKKMRASKGSGSPDGWHGQAVRHLPLGVPEAFSELASRWRRARYGPKAIRVARQINLVKENKVKIDTNTIEAGDLRPISVISVMATWCSCCWRTAVAA